MDPCPNSCPTPEAAASLSPRQKLTVWWWHPPSDVKHPGAMFVSMFLQLRRAQEIKKREKGQKRSTTWGPEGRERKGRKINNSSRNQRERREEEKRENKRKLMKGVGRRPWKRSGSWQVPAMRAKK